MQLSRLADQFVAYLGAYRGYSPRTIENYRLAYGQLQAFLQLQGLTDDVRHFTGDVVEAFARYLAAGGNRANSVNTKLAALSSLAVYAMRTKDSRGKYILADNPLARIERPQRQRVNRRFLHRDEAKALLTVECPANERVAIDLIFDTGLRVSELCRANVEDLWEDAKGQLVLTVTVKGRGRSQEKVHVPLGRAVAERLRALLGHREAGPEEPLLVNQSGLRYLRTVLFDMIARRARQAGIERIPVRAHTLRHTYNVVARSEAGLDEVQRAGLLNQTDTASVRRYDHLLPDETLEARERVRAGLLRYVGE
jgi:site-specific recombinase XerD